MNKISAIIVESNEEDLKLLKEILTVYCPEIAIAGEVSNVKEGIDLFTKINPKIVYLVAELKDSISFAMLDSIEYQGSKIIVVASCENYALKAIKYNATDYVLKPINTTNLIKATSKAVSQLKQKELVKEIFKKKVEFVALASIDKIDLININNIVYCESEGRYTRFYLINGDLKMSSRNLKHYEELLENSNFFRIHHQFLINVSKMTSINKAAGNYCELVNKMSLPISKRKFDGLCRYLRLK